jgi:hypothetical protein
MTFDRTYGDLRSGAATNPPRRRSAVPPEIAQFIERQEEFRSAAAALGSAPMAALAEIVTKATSRRELVEADALGLYQRCRRRLLSPCRHALGVRAGVKAAAVHRTRT